MRRHVFVYFAFVYVLGNASNATSQEAAQPAPVPLPPVVVEAKTPPPAKAKPARKKTKAKSKPQTVAAPAVQPGTDDAAQSAPPERSEATATGPVKGYVAERTVTGSKTDTPILEIPQAISVVPSDQIRDQGAETISEALRYTPGVVVQRDGAGARVDVVNVRGFEALNYLDGLALPQLADDFARPAIDPFALERIEILKGPASVLYGRNSPGGIVNMISKRPTDTPQNEVFVEFGSFEHAATGFDFSGPVTTDKKFLYRIVGMVQDAETQVDYTRDDRYFIAPSLTWQPDKDTSLTLLGHYGRDKGTLQSQYVPLEGTLFSNPNGRLPRSNFLGEPGIDHTDREQFWAGYIFSHRFNDVWQIRQNLRYTEVDSYTLAHQFGAFVDAGQRLASRTLFEPVRNARVFSVDTQAQADFYTGPLRHKALFGFDFSRSWSDYDFSGAFNAPDIDVFDPVYAGYTPDLLLFQQTKQNLEQYGFYVQDQIRLHSWILTLGARRDRVDGHSNTDSLFFPDPQLVDQNDYATTYRAALAYEFPGGLVPYFSYSTSFDPEIGVDRLGNPFKPTTGDQYEVGIKYQPPGLQNTLITAAAFDITRQNITTPDPVDPDNFSIQLGEVRARGYELEARSELTPNLSAIAAYSFLHTEVTESEIPEQLGDQIPGTPEHMASAWLYYTFHDGPLKGFGLGGGVRYVGAKEDTFGTTAQPSYTLFDAAAHYDLGNLDSAFEGARLSLSIHNIENEYYVTNCGLNFCFLGSERTFLSNLSFKW